MTIHRMSVKLAPSVRPLVGKDTATMREDERRKEQRRQQDPELGCVLLRTWVPPHCGNEKHAARLDRGDTSDLDIERPWMCGDIHEHACGRVLRKEFRIDAVDGGEHLHRCAIDGALRNVVEGGASGLHAEF